MALGLEGGPCFLPQVARLVCLVRILDLVCVGVVGVWVLGQVAVSH